MSGLLFSVSCLSKFLLTVFPKLYEPTAGSPSLFSSSTWQLSRAMPLSFALSTQTHPWASPCATFWLCWQELTWVSVCHSTAHRTGTTMAKFCKYHYMPVFCISILSIPVFREASHVSSMTYDCSLAITNPPSEISLSAHQLQGSEDWWIQSASFPIPHGLHLFGFSYCDNNILSHSYCLHQDMIQFSCPGS